MSGFEIAGLILGIIPLLTDAIHVARSLKDRYNSSRLAKKASPIENSLDRIRKEIAALQRQYGRCRIDIPEENASIIENDFTDLGNTLRDIVQRFKPLSKAERPNFFRDLKAILNSKEASPYDDIITQLDRAFERLRHMNQLLVNVTMSQCMSEKQNRAIEILESLKVPTNNSSVGEDTYTPSFYVPANPPIAKKFLDYDTLDEGGNPATFEGKLKGDLLLRVKKRHENPNELPIIGAVGMQGVGKTCALRGLGAEEDIRHLFHDGILYLPFSQSSSEQDIKQVLCSLVFQTGGHNLLKVMKQVVGENVIENIIGKVSAWFKNKKCLFLVDNIWNTSSTGSALLTKLSTVVENCDVTSGLVYTTTNEIDLFDATVRFKCLSPDSNASRITLMEAAGFSDEQIAEAGQEDALMTVLDHCKGLRIALVVAGRNIRLRARRYEEHKGKAWESYASALQDSPEILLTEDYGEYSSLYSQFSITLQTLRSLERQYTTFKMPYTIEEAFQALCVADKGQGIPDSMFRRLLRLKSTQQAREVAKLFADVSLVEITYEPCNGTSCEQIRVHDLVLDYASYLSDQNYIDRSWIKGSEVWALRLLESYFGVDEGLVSSPSAFTKWWNESVNTWNDEGHVLASIILRLAKFARTESGQNMSQHSSGVDRLFTYNLQYRRVEVVPFFTERKSALFEMHGFVNTMAQEREVHLSELTCRLLFFASLFLSKVASLMDGFPSALEAAGQFMALAMKRKATIFFEREQSDLPCDFKDIMTFTVYFFAQGVVPLDSWEYIKHMVEVSWTLYDKCTEATDLVDEERYDILGSPLQETILTDAGIQCKSLTEQVLYPVNGEMTDDLECNALSGRLVHEWADSRYRFLIWTLPLSEMTDDETRNTKRSMLYLHDLGNTTPAPIAPNYDLRNKLMDNIGELIDENWRRPVMQTADTANLPGAFCVLRASPEAIRYLISQDSEDFRIR